MATAQLLLFSSDIEMVFPTHNPISHDVEVGLVVGVMAGFTGCMSLGEVVQVC